MASRAAAATRRGRAPAVPLELKPLDHFNESLVLNAWLIEQFGIKPLSDAPEKPIRQLAHSILRIEEGIGADGLHRFYHAFKLTLTAAAPVKQDALLRYEENILALTKQLNAGRERKIVWKYFQWLTLVFMEHYLDRFFQDRDALLEDLNRFVPEFNNWRTGKGYAGRIAPFTKQELNKVCLQNATGSGKTLLMHANLLQFRHYAHAANKRHEYARALLLTPGEDLTAQHLRELQASGLRAQRFVADLLATTGGDLASVDALELTKLAEKDGDKTIAVRNFGDANVLLVDEGHVGMNGTEETGFMARRDALSARGFVFEYSATFAQAVAAAKSEDMAQAYAKSVLFDYSYRYFYEDGYGKDYQVFNLADTRFDEWHTRRLYLTACLLSFYQQMRVFEEQRNALAAFNLEKPLWVFVGASVTRANGGTQDDRATSSDVKDIVQFVADFLHDWQQSEHDIGKVMAGEVQDGNWQDLFAHTFGYLHEKLQQGETLQALHQDVLRRLFGGGGGLRLTRVSGETAEIRLHTGDAGKPFGLINVGDAPGLMGVLQTCEHVQEEESQFASGAMFGSLNDSASPINLLIGSRKFVAGWDCWRVSTLGLMNIGRSEGSQIIQLFGRGVRLKGKDWSLKRSSKLAHVTPPPHIQVVETLGVFGVKADYMNRFREVLEAEGLPGNQRRAEKTISMNVVDHFGAKLMVLAPKTKRHDGRAYDFLLDAPLPLLNEQVPPMLMKNPVRVDCTPRFQAIVAGVGQDGAGAAPAPVYLDGGQLAFMDWAAIWLELEDYKRLRGFTYLVIEKSSLPKLFAGERRGWYQLFMPASQLTMSWANVAIWKKVVLELLKRYVEAFYNHHKKAFFEPRLELQELTSEHPNLQVEDYCLSWETQQQASQDQVMRDLELLEQEIKEAQYAIVPDKPNAQVGAALAKMQLLTPLLHVKEGGKISVTPVPLKDSEFDFVRDLSGFLETKPALLDGVDIYLLRNKARGGGIGFFEAGAFYPDFILWLVCGNEQRVVFVEPHGLRMEKPDSPKLKFYQTIKDIEARVNQGRAEKIRLECFIATPTLLNNLSGELGFNSVEECAARHVLLMKNDGDYIQRMFGMLG